MSFDDLYNYFKIIKQEVKGSASSSSSSSSQNMAFVSSSSSTNEVNTAYGVSISNTQVSPASTQVSTASTQVSTANLSDATVYAFLANQLNGSQLVHEDLEQIYEDDLEEMDLKWQLAVLSIRTRKGPRNQDNMSGNQDNSRRTINVKEISSKAMLAMMELVLTRALWQMKKSLQIWLSWLFQTLRIEFNKSEFNLAAYKRGLASVEEQLVFYKKNEVIFCEQLAILKRDISYKDSVLKSNEYSLKDNNQAKTDKTEHGKNQTRDWKERKKVKVKDKKSKSKSQRRSRIRRNLKWANPAKGKGKVNTARPKAVNTGRPNTVVVNAVRANQVNAVKALACWVWRATKLNSASITFKRHNYVDARGISKHMTGKMSYLSDFKEFDEGYFTFSGRAKGGRITGKGTLKTGKHNFVDVYFVKELQINLFSVSQMCEKKNSVLFTDTGCFVLSHDFKLADESQALLKVPRKNNMYSVDMKNIVPKESLTCLVAKATLDESMLWHKRLGHVKFKTINKRFKDNLMKGLPIKHFENDQTCIACLKGKQYKASSSKDETSGILKSFITQIENLVDKKVKIIRCDNGTEFKNRVMSEFCEKKGIKREFSVARTPQQNGVAERRNRTLIEAARTMLADSKLPTTFWAEAVNTACYVQNRVLVVKPHNKTPYELFIGRTPSLSFMKPFGYHVTILNTLDHLGKFDGKFDDDCCDGPKWLFDIDVLTKSMNYVPVIAGTNSNDSVDGSLFNSSLKNAINDEPQPSNDARKKDDEGGIVPTAPLESTYADFFGDESKLDLSNIATIYPVPSTLNTRIYKDHSLDHVIDDVQSGVQTRRMINEQGFISAIYEGKTHEDLHTCLFACFLSQEEPKKVIQALKDPSWIEAMQEELLQFKLQQVWILVDLPYGKRAIRTKWVYKNKKDERVARIEAISLFLAYASFKDFVVYQMDVKSAFLYGMIEKEVYVYQPPGFEDLDFPDKVYKDKYVDEILKKFWFSTMKTASIPMETSKPLLKDAKAEDVDVHLYRSMIGSLMYLTASRPDIMFAVCSHLHVVKRIFRYLKGQPKLGLWYPKDSPFDLEAYTDSDYASVSLDRKSTTGGCQFLRRRLISWQCKKQTIVANSTTKAEYVATSSCCEQVLWIQNQMLDYGYNFMNTKIHIDNESTICIVKNPVFHSKTKHIKIRHHFIRDSNEKKLIQMIKIRTDHNVADLLTKAFDVRRFQYMIAMRLKEKGLVRINIDDGNAFWNGIEAKTVDGKEFTITEASVRRHLQLADVDGISVLPTTKFFDQLSLMGGSPRCQEAMGGSIAQTRSVRAPPPPCDSPLPRVHTLGSDEGSMTLQELMVLCTTLSKKVESLEADLKQTKQVYGASYTRLIMKVKKLENTVKTSHSKRRAKIVVLDDEEDSGDSSKQGRMIEEIDHDAGVTLVTPTQGEDQPEDQLGVLSIAKVLADAAKINVHYYIIEEKRQLVMVDSGGIFGISFLLKETVSTAGTSIPVSTAGMVQEVNISIPSPVVVKDKGKGKMEESEDEQRSMGSKTGAGWFWLIGGDLEKGLYKLGCDRGRLKMIKEWENIRARVETDEELTQRLQAEERNKYSEVDQAKMLHMGSHTLQQLKIYSFDELKELFETTMKNVNTFVPMETEDRGRASELATGSSQATIIDSAEVGSSKRVAAEELDHEGSKRQNVTPPNWATAEYDVAGVLLHRSIAQDMRTTSIRVV
ncbi:putative ribonuclease H-like domain-containing protein [Tanacetum coccineum]